MPRVVRGYRGFRGFRMHRPTRNQLYRNVSDLYYNSRQPPHGQTLGNTSVPHDHFQFQQGNSENVTNEIYYDTDTNGSDNKDKESQDHSLTAGIFNNLRQNQA
uniref:Uncharacterized protein n=1 Tax=Picea glauca TaxID=3330 RepID=A0A101LVU6_PICGL|nr:hypothetical protein ABT39_MTgene1790 [Picea glauca]